MGIKGLTTTLEKDPKNYVDFKLRDTFVVVDFCNYMSRLYQKDLASQYGGEYVEFFDVLSSNLNNFKKCNVTPIFVMDGCHEPHHEKLNELLNRRTWGMNDLVELKHKIDGGRYPDTDDIVYNTNAVPRFLARVMNRCLEELQVYHISCDFESDAETAALAAYLGCPVISGDSDFYIFQHSIQQLGYKFIPTSKLTNHVMSDGPGKFYLACQYFRKETSTLKEIPNNLLPILADMLGNDTIVSVMMPPEINKLVYTESLWNGLSKNQRRIASCIHWLGEQSKSSTVGQILDTLVNCQPAASRNEFIRLLHYTMRQFFLPTHVIAPIYLKQLGGLRSSSGIPKLTRPAITASMRSLITKPSLQSIRIFLDTSGAFSGPQDTYENYGMTQSWPVKMHSFFKKCHFNQSTFDAIYTNIGYVTRPLLEDVSSLPSSLRCSLSLRRLFYGLLLHMEQTMCSRSITIGYKDGRVCEYLFDYGKAAKTMITVHPISAASLSSLLLEHCSLQSIDENRIPNWLQGIVLMVAFHKLNTNYLPLQECFYQVFILLAVFTKQVVDASNNLVQTMAQLRKKFANFCVQLKKTMVPAKGLDLQLMSSNSELQGVYDALFAVNSLLVAISDNSNNSLAILPESFVVFPSGRLWYFLVKQQQTELSTLARPLFVGSEDLLQSSLQLVNKSLQEVERLVSCSEKYKL